MTGNKPQPGSDAFHRERSKCVDAFADLESAVRANLEAAGVKVGAESFGLKLGKLAKLEPSPKLSKTRATRLQDIAKRCQILSEIRNDIVHARLKLAMIEDEHKACFTNLNQIGRGGQTARLFGLRDLRELSAEVSAMANELVGLVANPPSSPPPPLPGEAGGP